jgi:signal transduction histidine kinase
LFASARIQLVVDLPQSPLFAMADPAYLHRLLNIVLENAGKYTPAGGMVHLALFEEDSHARFEIRDTGIGIPAQDLAFIFERFRRGSNAQQASDHGSGLGLALAAWIAECHGTAIRVESEPGIGSTFRWTLALADGPASADRGASRPAAIESIAVPL